MRGTLHASKGLCPWIHAAHNKKNAGTAPLCQAGHNHRRLTGDLCCAAQPRNASPLSSRLRKIITARDFQSHTPSDDLAHLPSPAASPPCRGSKLDIPRHNILWGRYTSLQKDTPQTLKGFPNQSGSGINGAKATNPKPTYNSKVIPRRTLNNISSQTQLKEREGKREKPRNRPR